jgi:regulation of enolase protein 1 (concanavalin A-like superfamily)
MSEDLIQQMTWLNEPASSSRAGEGLRVRARPKTDFWRTTFYGYVTDNGHFLHKSVAGTSPSKRASAASTRLNTTRRG